jgi:multiple sugar transport system permease protein
VTFPPAKRLASLGRHLLLAAGALAFALPFFWLLSSSFKEHEELISPRWLPGLPAKVDASPYLDPPPPLERPEALKASAWEELEPLLLAEVEKGLLALGHPGVQATQSPQVRRALAVEMARRLLKRAGQQDRPLGKEEFVAHLCRQLDLELLDYAWNKVHPQVLLGDLTAEFADGRQESLLRPDTTGQGPLSWGPLLSAQERPGRQLRCDFGQGRILRLTLPLPGSLDPAQIRRLVLPVRGDRSYHDLYLELDTGGDRYRSRVPFALENSRWMDALWTFGEPSLRERRTVYYSASLSPLDRLGPSQGPSLTLELRQVPYPAVLWRRFAKNYAGALLAIPFLRYLRNTLVLVVLNILAQLLSCSLIAYGFSRLRWPGRDWVFGLVLATMMLPPQVTMIPQFLVWRGLGQYDTFQPLWLPSLFGSGFFIFLMRQFMLTLPRDLEEAARIDGCGHLATFWHVILPLLRPPLAAVGIFQFMGTWNDFLGPLIYLSSEDLAPLSLGLFRFQGSHYVSAVGEVGLLMAASLLMTLPVILLFFFAQRYFIQGVTFTGMRN